MTTFKALAQQTARLTNFRAMLGAPLHAIAACALLALPASAGSASQAADCNQRHQESAATDPAHKFLEKYVEWAKGIDREGLERGARLDATQLQLAKDVGIKHPERVRLVWVDAVPFPMEDKFMRTIGESIGFVGPGIVNNAQAFGYAIWVRKGFNLDRPNLAHEFVHVRQIEQSGDFGGFVSRYMQQLQEFRHEEMPIEQEAYEANRTFAE